MKDVVTKTPITYYGGKQLLLRHILPLIPEHEIYTEAFAGGAAVFFAKDPAKVEVINDINAELINFYQVFKRNSKELHQEIDATIHSRNLHVFARFIYTYPEHFTKVKRAWALWYLSKSSFASRLDGSFGYDKTKNQTSKKILNSKEYALAETIAHRLENTQIESTDALKIIKSRDTSKAFHFTDPPYIGTDCGHYCGYTEEEFIRLLKLLETIEGKFMLTMFPNETLTGFVIRNNWKVVEVERTISAAKTSRRKQIELIVMNY
ncbi:MAG: DNA adenine methylase [Bacteroidales bacterium]|nr:DNA adenine methylase [Bacteroidales bacterium]